MIPPGASSIVAVVLTAVTGAGGALGWRRAPRATPSSRRTVAVLLGAVCLVGAASAVVADTAAPAAGWWRWVVLAVTGLTACLGGGGLTRAVLWLADHDAVGPGATIAFPGLRGGAWIGVLERLGIFAGLAAGYPEAAALIIAVKSLARYPELRAGPNPGVAERFIIGTFTSMAVAAGCAGLAHLLLS